MVMSMWSTGQVERIIKFVGRPSILGICFLVFSTIAGLIIFGTMLLPILTGQPETANAWSWKSYC